MSILIKEHFNRWYSLKMYYLSITIVDLPISVNWFMAVLILHFILIDIFISDSLLCPLYSNYILDDRATIRMAKNRNVYSYIPFGCFCCTEFWTDDWCHFWCCGMLLFILYYSRHATIPLFLEWHFCGSSSFSTYDDVCWFWCYTQRPSSSSLLG